LPTGKTTGQGWISIFPRGKMATQGWISVLSTDKTVTRARFAPLPVARKPLCIRVSEERASGFMFFRDFVFFC
jgi:hypothetical protein